MKKLVNSEIRLMVRHNGADIKANLYGMFGTNKKQFEKFIKILEESE